MRRRQALHDEGDASEAAAADGVSDFVIGRGTEEATAGLNDEEAMEAMRFPRVA